MFMEKGVALLSGGIDSPVAIHMMQNRLDIIAAHFHQEPLTDKKEVEKVKELAQKLGLEKVYLIPFVPMLKALVDKCDHKNYFILQKILMFKGAEKVAVKEGAKNLITGENLGQVSSQTLSNLRTISSHVDIEIFRPLLTFDKQEIINIAKKIETYEISKGPEICNLLGPKSPATKSKPELIAKELDGFDWKILLEEALNKAEVLSF
jgi:tRNA uracil 4-sulfurtransferase